MNSCNKLLFFLVLTLLCSCTTPQKDFSKFKAKAKKHNNILSVPDFETKASDIAKNIDQAIADADKGIAQIVAIKAKDRTFENTITALDDVFNNYDKVIGRQYLLNSVSTDKAIRDEATNSINKNSKWYNGVFFREDLYNAVKQYADKKEKLTGERKKTLKELIIGFKRNGFHLSKKKRKELEQIKLETSLLQTKFSNNVKNWDKTVTFTAKELEGVPASALSGLKKGKNNTYIMSPTLYSHYSIVATHSKDSNARRKALMARWTVAKEKNAKILTKIIKLRAKTANILGYKNFADYQVEERMAKTGDRAISFLTELSNGLENKLKTELETLRQYKVKETGDKNAQLDAWDHSYYQNIYLKEKFALDKEAMRVYFPLNRVLNGMFDVYETMFGIKIEEAKAPYKWIDDLKLYVVTDKQTGEPLGTLYMDMFPREGKYKHFAQFSILAGKKMQNGMFQRPIGVLVCNFPKPTEGKPSLLKFDHVETLFHEFGHALHNVLSKTEFTFNHGTAVARDFVEAPSQMLEFWARDKTVLDQFAADYRDSSKKIPADFLDKMERAKKATIARGTRGQIAFGMMDLTLHTKFKSTDHFNVTKVSNAILEKYSTKAPEGTSFISTFGHVAGGYAAGYYGYQWALAIAHDMATVFENSPDKYLDKAAGMKLRREIYQVGNSIKAEKAVINFLGREWNTKAYLEKLGI